MGCSGKPPARLAAGVSHFCPWYLTARLANMLGAMSLVASPTGLVQVPATESTELFGPDKSPAPIAPLRGGGRSVR